MREMRRMERFAADAIRAERTEYIKADLKAGVPWTDLSERYGLSLPEIEKIVIESTPGATRKGSTLIITPDDPEFREEVQRG